MKRILLYSPDAVGLGHVRRLLKIAGALGERLPGTAMLLVTGCATTLHLERRPPGLDFLRLPSWQKVGPERFEPRDLPLPPGELLALRAQVHLQTATSFRPDVLLVDHDPLGRAGELTPTLRWLRDHAPECRVVLGLRDVLDDAATVRSVWSERGIYAMLDRFYDLILVYGSRDLFDVAREYAIPEATARKVRYVGYLGLDRPPRLREETRRQLGVQDSLVVANAGGGADGYPLLSCFLDALTLLPRPVRSLAITGPLMPRGERETIVSRAHLVPGCTVVEYLPDLPDVLAAADAVVSMCGYNAATELAALGRRAIVVPRGTPRQEQLLRARLFADRGLVDLLPAEDLAPVALAGRLRRELEAPAPSGPGRPALDLGGLGRVAALLAHLLVGETVQPVLPFSRDH